MLSLTPRSKDPHPPLGSKHTLSFLDQAACPESLYWALKATALDREGINRVLGTPKTVSKQESKITIPQMTKWL